MFYEFDSYTDTSFYKITDRCDVYILSTDEIRKYISDDKELYKFDLSGDYEIVKLDVKNSMLEWIRKNCIDVVYYHKKILYFTNRNDYLMFRLSGK